MTRFPTILAVASITTIALEVIGTILLFVPARTLVVRRTVVASLFIVFRVGIAIFMGIGLFPFVLMVAWLVFMPTEFWDRVQGLRVARDSELTVHLEKSPLLTRTTLTAFVFVFVSNLFTWFCYPSPPAFAAHDRRSADTFFSISSGRCLLFRRVSESVTESCHTSSGPHSRRLWLDS